MRHSLWYKRIPTLLGLFLLGVGIFSLSWLAQSGALFTSHAAPPYEPKNIRISNLSDTSFTVSYQTTEQVTGSLTFWADQSGKKVILDDRDQQTGTPQNYYIHHITIRNLIPETAYSFSITSADKTFLDHEQPFHVTTLFNLSETPPPQTPIVGKVVNPDGTPGKNIIVYLVSDNTQVFSVLTKDDGSFAMPLNALRTKDNTNYVRLQPASIIKLLLTGATLSSKVTVLASQISPVPQITLGNTYDFSTSVAPVTVTPSASSSAQDSDDDTSFPSFSATEANPGSPRILTPDDKETFSDQQPQFAGTAPPQTSVTVLIHSDQEIKATITTDKNGSWTFRPTTKLAPGEHTITISAKDSNGILQTIQRSFTVYAEGGQFVEPSVAPSPTPTPFVIPSDTPTPTPTDTPTPTPTSIVTPPPTISVPPPTKSPGSTAVVLSSIIAAVTISVGLLLLFLGRGSSV